MEEILYGAGKLCLYYITAASTALGCRILFRIPDELFRKILHFILLGSYPIFLFSFQEWWKAVLLAVLLEIAIYPILAFFERFKSYTSMTTERKKGELKHSLLLAFTMLAAAMTVCWGLLDDRLLVLACMYAWGVGDAFAALIGKRFGRHKLRLRGVISKKSVEGSAAMFLTSWTAVSAVLLYRGGMAPISCLLVAAAGAAVCTLVELYTPNGMDTVTCPTAALCTILPLTALLGGIL